MINYLVSSLSAICEMQILQEQRNGKLENGKRMEMRNELVR